MTARNDAIRLVDGTPDSVETTSELTSARLVGEPNPADLAERWTKSCRRLRAELGEAVFSAWFARLELDRIEDDVAYLSVPTNFLKTWIQSHYVDKLTATLSAEVPEVKRCVVALRSSSRPMAAKLAEPVETASEPAAAVAPPPRAEPAGRSGTAAPDALASSPLDRRLTFANFVVGRSNGLAFAAAKRVAEAAPGDAPIYSPLYIHAAVGLGKTHLLQATAHAVVESGRRVIYLTAERFMYGFVAALKAQTSIVFKEKLRAIDALIIDDVQFLQGKIHPDRVLPHAERSSSTTAGRSSSRRTVRPTISKRSTSAYARD